jgi:hypothetical protein
VTADAAAPGWPRRLATVVRGPPATVVRGVCQQAGTVAARVVERQVLPAAAIE